MSTFSEKEIKEALKILGFSENEDPSKEVLDQRIEMLLEKEVPPTVAHKLQTAYHQLIQMVENKISSYDIPHSFKPIFTPSKETNQDVTIMVQTDSNLNQTGFSKDFNTQLQANLNGLGITPNSRFFVGGSPQSTLGIMSRNILLMRCRFGSLFRTGGASIELTLEALEATKPKDLAIEALTVIKSFIEHPEKVQLFIKGTSEKISHVLEALKTVAKAHGFNPTNISLHEVKTEITEVVNKVFHPSPFHVGLKPKSFEE